MAVLEQTAVLTDAIRPVPASELEARLEKFRRLMDEMHPGWEMAAVNVLFHGYDAGGRAAASSAGCSFLGAPQL